MRPILETASVPRGFLLDACLIELYTAATADAFHRARAISRLGLVRAPGPCEGGGWLAGRQRKHRLGRLPRLLAPPGPRAAAGAVAMP